ncbi:MAG TPA: BTAD domain-containing putative transcriptional regulator, partial [Actinomycetes bacterium]|nr:BTAD domain-containing putative transcriptional regulator [Actinomycetes bacterium]
MRVGVLGPVEVHAGGGQRIELAGPRLRAVVAQLALAQGRLVTLDRLIDGIWGDDPPAAAVNALQSLISRLRRALPAGDAETIAAQPGGYRLAIDAADLDSAAFERLVSQGRAAFAAGESATASGLLHEALSLWRGPPLADLVDAPFAAVPAARLTELRLAVLEDRIEADLRLGRHAELVPELEALTAENPLRERLSSQLMRALYGTGRQADALAAYDRLRRRLADDLGIDPSPELEQVHLAVLRQDPLLLPAAPPAVTEPPRTNLRAQLTSFVGRTEEVARLGKLIADTRLVTLVGPGGSGKTRLAEEAAQRLVDSTPDGVWMVEFAPVSDPLEVPQAVLDAAGVGEISVLETQRSVSPAARPGTMQRLVAAVAGRRMLLLFDNCEHLIEPSARLAEQLLALGSDLRILATSREPLGIAGESLFSVPPLALPPVGASAEEARTYPAVRLLLDRAAAVRPEFALTAESAGAVVEVCRRLDGLPLAIELAAARLRSLSIAEIADRLGDRFRLLTGGSRTALPRHRTLAAVVEWSWDLLSEAERAIARRLAVFAGGADLEAVDAICAGDDVPREDVVEHVGSLVDKSLVLFAGDVATRYRMLETIRAFAADRLAESGEAERFRRAHAAYFVALAERVEPELRRAGQLDWLAMLRAEEDNFLAALRWATDSADARTAVRLVTALGWGWMMRAPEAALTWIKEALDVPGDVPAVDRAEATALLALGYGAADDFGAGRAAAQQTRELAKDIPPAQRRLATMLSEPLFPMFDGDYEEAHRGLDRISEHPDPWVRAIGRLLRGWLKLNDGDAIGGEEQLTAALVEFQALGERWGLANATSAVAELRAARGDVVGAIGAREVALGLATEVGARDDIVKEFIQLAVLRARAGDMAGAQADIDSAMRARRRDRPLDAAGHDDTVAGATDTEVFIQTAVGGIAWLRGDLAEARARLDKALALCDAVQNFPRQIRGMVLTAAACIDISEGEYATAERQITEAALIGVETRDMPVAGGALDAAASAAAARNRWTDAARLLGMAAA